MQVSSGRPHMLTSNQRGRGKEPVVVLGRIRSFVAVNMVSPNRHFMLIRFVGDFVVSGGGYFLCQKTPISFTASTLLFRGAISPRYSRRLLRMWIGFAKGRLRYRSAGSFAVRSGFR